MYRLDRMDGHQHNAYCELHESATPGIPGRGTVLLLLAGCSWSADEACEGNARTAFQSNEVWCRGLAAGPVGPHAGMDSDATMKA
jgi:hypothetical protein